MGKTTIHKVPMLLLKEQHNIEDYIPKVVSISPYHHGNPELGLAESFKPKALDLFVSCGKEEKNFYHDKIFEVISEIRMCYEEQSTDIYKDRDLARMMLHDACLIIIHMEISLPPAERAGEPRPLEFLKASSMHQHLGMLTMAIVLRDLLLLENQIPFWILKLLIRLRYEEEEGQELLNRYLNMTLFEEYRQKSNSPSETEEEPIHLLDAFRRLIISDHVEVDKIDVGADLETNGDLETGPQTSVDQTIGCSSCFSRLATYAQQIKTYMRSTTKEGYEDVDRNKYWYSFRSLTDLKSKGIHFRPSPTQSLKDVNFKSNFIYAQHQLPISIVSIYTKVGFLNMIAYEFSPNNYTNGEVTSYIDLMKSLIETPEDVKELRQQKILINMLGSDEEVLNVYKEINTYEGSNRQIFHGVKEKIQAHYNSKRKTWIAELIHTYFISPWTVITFLVAITLLCLDSIQTFYAMHPKSDK